MTPLDERPHEPGEDPRWLEAWLFDVVDQNASIAMSIELMLWPQHHRAAFHASVLQRDEPLVSLVESDASAPRAPSLEVRAPGLWTDVGIQTALDHVTVDVEAFAVALDDPADVFAGAYGIRTALGCELEWETSGVLRHGPSASSYEVPCIVHGELLIDQQTIDIDGWGWRSHRWGVPTPTDRTGFRGRAVDGTWLHHHDLAHAPATTVTGSAPVPDPAVEGRLAQFFCEVGPNAHAWTRRPI